MTAEKLDLVELVRAVREGLTQFPVLEYGLIADLGLDRGLRDQLLLIARNPMLTVLSIADAAPASAVDVQRDADRLRKLGMIDYVWPEPDDRIPRLRVSARGLAAIQEISRREQNLVAEIARACARLPVDPFTIDIILNQVAREIAAENAPAAIAEI